MSGDNKIGGVSVNVDTGGYPAWVTLCNGHHTFTMRWDDAALLAKALEIASGQARFMEDQLVLGNAGRNK